MNNKSDYRHTKREIPANTANSVKSDEKRWFHSCLTCLWDHFEFPAFMIALLLCLLCLVEFHQNVKWLIMVCSIISAGMIGFAFWKGLFLRRANLPTLAVALYFLIVAASVCWTCAGKFFLREYSKLLFVLPVFLLVVLYLPNSKRATRNLLLVICSMSAIFAVLGVDLASAAITWPWIGRIPGIDMGSIRNTWSVRLPGIFANANISGGVHGFAILLTFGLFSEDNRIGKNAWAAFLGGVQVFTFVLGLNRSAIAFLCFSLFLALVCAGTKRGTLFGRILMTVIPPAAIAFLTSEFFPTLSKPIEGRQLYYPLLSVLLSGVISAVLELIFDVIAKKTVRKHRKWPSVLLGAFFLAVVAYAFAAVFWSGSLSIPSGSNIRRAAYPAAGEYTLKLETDGNVNVAVYSQNYEQASTAKYTTLYKGLASESAFSVAEEDQVVYFDFSTENDCTITRASVVGKEKSYKIHLGYPLLPEAMSSRLVGIWATQNLVERILFFRDGLKIWKDYPIFGAGLGAFESLIAGYQEFRYVTRYVHNHYIQVLVDNGIVGLASYLFILVSCFLCILRGRKEDDPFHELFAPMMGAFVMLVLHSFMDVIMSTTAYLPFAYAFFGICALCWGKPLSKKWLAMAGQIGLGLVSLTYAVLISLNIRANSIVAKASNNPVRFFSALDSAIKMDAFEYTDWKVSYLTASAQVGAPEYKARADQYAAELLDVPSNSLHAYLVNYYLGYQDYDVALQAAQNGTHFNYADADTWNHYFGAFQGAAETCPEDAEEIYRITLALSDCFDTEMKRMFNPISLNSESLAWIETARGAVTA